MQLCISFNHNIIGALFVGQAIRSCLDESSLTILTYIVLCDVCTLKKCVVFFTPGWLAYVYIYIYIIIISIFLTCICLYIYIYTYLYLIYIYIVLYLYISLYIYIYTHIFICTRKNAYLCSIQTAPRHRYYIIQVLEGHGWRPRWFPVSSKMAGWEIL